MADETQYVYSPTRMQQPGVGNVVFVYEATTMQPCTLFNIELPVAPPAATAPETPVAADKFTCEVGRVWDVQSKDGYAGWTHVPHVVVPEASDTAVDAAPVSALPEPAPVDPPPIAVAPTPAPTPWLATAEVLLHRTVDHVFGVLHWLRRGGR